MVFYGFQKHANVNKYLYQKTYPMVVNIEKEISIIFYHFLRMLKNTCIYTSGRSQLSITYSLAKAHMDTKTSMLTL